MIDFFPDSSDEETPDEDLNTMSAEASDEKIVGGDVKPRVKVSQNRDLKLMWVGGGWQWV